VPLIHFESMQDVQLFAVGAAAGTRGTSGGATATGGRSGSNSGGGRETYGHAGAPRMLLVGSRSSGVSICTFFVPVSKYFCTSKASEHLVCQARACSPDTYRFLFFIRQATATAEQLSTASAAGRVQRNEARFSREDIYVDVC
jgi:hypothetical protein